MTEIKETKKKHDDDESDAIIRRPPTSCANLNNQF